MVSKKEFNTLKKRQEQLTRIQDVSSQNLFKNKKMKLYLTENHLEGRRF